jgi:hypothetical protein
MKFTGYWVSVHSGKVFLERSVFDETELDPATNWKQAWQNQDSAAPAKGYVELSAALAHAAQVLAAAEGRNLSQLESELASQFDPTWVEDRSEIQSLSSLLDSSAGSESP